MSEVLQINCTLLNLQQFRDKTSYTCKSIIMIKTKWFIYTVLVGLIPFLIRFFIFIISNNKTSDYIFNEVDLVTFGLVLNITNINEIDGKENVESIWRTKNIGISVVMLILFAAFLGITYFSEDDKINVNRFNLKSCAVILSIVSALLSYSIFNRLNTMKSQP